VIEGLAATFAGRSHEEMLVDALISDFQILAHFGAAWVPPCELPSREGVGETTHEHSLIRHLARKNGLQRLASNLRNAPIWVQLHLEARYQ
jgi:hypothetical protein